MQLSPLSKLNPWGAPTLEGFDMNNIQDGQRLKGSNRQYVRFYKKKFMQPYTTRAKINPVTGSAQPLEMSIREVEKEFVEIITPGDKNTVDDIAEDFHKREHWQAYKAFRDGKTAPIGTSIEECAFIPGSVITELLYLGVHTQEQMADASDLLCDRVPGGWELRETCKAICKANLENANLSQVNALRSEMTRMKELADQQAEMILELKKQMEEQKAIPAPVQIIETSLEDKPKKRGRKAKTEEITVNT